MSLFVILLTKCIPATIPTHCVKKKLHRRKENECEHSDTSTFTAVQQYHVEANCIELGKVHSQNSHQDQFNIEILIEKSTLHSCGTISIERRNKTKGELDLALLTSAAGEILNTDFLSPSVPWLEIASGAMKLSVPVVFFYERQIHTPCNYWAYS